MEHLPLTAALADYEAQAEQLLHGHAQGDPGALQLIHNHHPRFLDQKVKWLPLRLSDEDLKRAPFDANDARLAIARWYSFLDWESLKKLVLAVQDRTPGVYEFESAAEAMITGDLSTLSALLQQEPKLVHARSTRITNFDPPVHAATLLHYTAANGIEGHRQRTPANAVEIATALLEAGADPNALAHMYGGECTPLPMLVSSSWPAAAGLQTQLAELLVDYGADVNGRGNSNWASPLWTALVFGYRDTAEALVRKGAKVDRLSLAAGLGRTEQVRTLLATADDTERHRALALASQLGRTEVVRTLLDAGEDPNRFNPERMHAHSTPLHQAALAGHDDVVRLLVERGARLDIRDKIWNGTPRGWAEHGGKHQTAAWLDGRERQVN